MRDELDGSTALVSEEPRIDEDPDKNVEEPQETMEFSTPISDVLDSPNMKGFSSIVDAVDGGGGGAPAPASKKVKTQYPLNLKLEQIEALIAGFAGVVGFSDIIQNKLVDTFPQMLSDTGKLSLSGMGLTLLIIAVIFYFGRRFILNR
jgi:hypothetical protein